MRTQHRVLKRGTQRRKRELEYWETCVSETTKDPIGTRLTHHNMRISQNYVGHLENVHSNVRQNLVVGREAICLGSTSARWSVEFSCPRQWRRRYVLDRMIKKIWVPPRRRTSIRWNNWSILRGNWSWIKSRNYMEYLRLIGIQFHGWEVLKLSTARVCVFLDLGGRIAEYPRSVKSWTDKIDWFTQIPEYRKIGWCWWKTSRVRVEHTEVTPRGPECDGDQWRSEGFKDRIIFMSMYSDVDWWKAENKDICMSNSSRVAAYVKRCLWKDIGHSFGPETEGQW